MKTAQRIATLQDLCRLIDPSCETGISDLAKEGMETVITLADSMLVLPMLRSGLQRRGAAGLLCVDQHEMLETIWQLNAQRNRDLIREAREVAQILAQIDIRAVFLKGMAQILAGSHDAGGRMVNDLDILVPENRLREALDHLQRCGFSPGPGKPFVDAARLRPFAHHAPPLRRHENAPWVEIHRAFFADPDFLLPAHEIIASARPVSQKDWTAWIPAPEHQMGMAIAHASLRGLERFGAGISLRDMADCLALRDQVDLPALERRFHAHGVLGELRWFSALLGRLCGSGAELVPTSWHRRMQARLILRGWAHAGWRRALAPGKPLHVPLRFASSPIFRRHVLRLVQDAAYRRTWRQAQ